MQALTLSLQPLGYGQRFLTHRLLTGTTYVIYSPSDRLCKHFGLMSTMRPTADSLGGHDFPMNHVSALGVLSRISCKGRHRSDVKILALSDRFEQ
jgi:hypothetical protein